jgi:CDP-diacylglycerol--serine O-phosphatidyltransferase
MLPTSRKRRFKVVSLSTLIPNLITVMALCSGLTGIRFALQERWEFAVGAIAVAAVLDTLDGRMARLLNGQSKFGAELDSLADFISFGVSPAVILFLWSTQDVSGFGWMCALFYATCMALRLARFNTKLDEVDPPPFASRFFTGVPAPAAAGLGCLPLILSFVIGEGVLSHPIFVAIWMVLIGLMMVSSIPTYSFKGTRLPQKLMLPLLVIAGLVIAGFLSEPWMTLGGIIIAYLVTTPLSFRGYRRLMAMHLATKGDAPAKANEEPGTEGEDKRT